MTGFPLEQVTNGAELRLGAGTFQVTAPLVIDKDIVLTGAGQNSTTITMGGTNDLIISVTEAEVTITDLTTDGGFGVNVNESEIDIQRVTFQRSSLDGLTISNSVGTVTDSISQDNAVGGFSWAGETSGVASNNTAQNNQIDGFEIGWSAALELTGNTSKDNAGAGFAWYDEASGVASNNTAQNNQYKAFDNQSSGDLELWNNNEE